jgi:hypothetical protein
MEYFSAKASALVQKYTCKPADGFFEKLNVDDVV